MKSLSFVVAIFMAPAALLVAAAPASQITPRGPCPDVSNLHWTSSFPFRQTTHKCPFDPVYSNIVFFFFLGQGRRYPQRSNGSLRMLLLRSMQGRRGGVCRLDTPPN